VSHQQARHSRQNHPDSQLRDEAKPLSQGDQHSDAAKQAGHLSKDLKQRRLVAQRRHPNHPMNSRIKQDHSQPPLNASKDNELAHHKRFASQGSNEFTCHA
jgi:hypothetical protein